MSDGRVSTPGSPARPISREALRPEVLPVVVFAVLVVRVIAAMVIPGLREPGWPDFVVLSVAVVIGGYLLVTQSITRPRWGAIGAVSAFWLTPAAVAPIHGQSVPVATVMMAAVTVVLIAGPPDSTLVVRLAVGSGSLILALSVLYGLLSALGVMSGAFHSVGPDYQRAVLGVPALRGITLHPNTLGALAAVVLIMGLALALANRRLVAYVPPALAVICLLWSQSRSGIGSALAAVVILLTAAKWPKSRPYLVAVGLALAVLPVLVTWRFGTVIDFSGIFTGRDSAWGPALLLFRDSPLVGFGPEAFSKEFWAEHPGLWWEPLHAHNELLEVGAQAGMVGVVALVALTCVGVSTALSRTGWNGALLVALALFVGLQAGVEVPLGLTYFPISYLLPAIVVAAFACSRSLRGKKSTDGHVGVR